MLLDTNLKSFVGNLHILKPPYVKVNYPGVSFFTVSPIFIYIFGIKKLSKILKMLLVPIIIITFILLTYYWTGWLQVGPRYLLDLLPFLFIFLLASFTDGRLPKLAKYVIPASALFNFYLMLTVSFFKS